MKSIQAFLVILLLLSSIACNEESPVNSCTPLPSAIFGKHGIYALCEGIWKYDNATLTRFDEEAGTVVSDFYARANCGFRLGDTANDIVLKGDTAFVAVSTSRTIEIFLVSTGKRLGRITLSGKKEPRSLVIINDSTAFVSNLNDDSITEFNPTTFTISTENIAVGPAPEGICADDSFVFAANSGYGDFRANEPKAGTISVVSLAEKREIRVIPAGANVRTLQLSADKSTLYAFYQHLASKPDSLPGIIEFDAKTFMEIRRISMKNLVNIALHPNGKILYALSENGVFSIDLAQKSLSATLLFANQQSLEHWYSLAVNPRTGSIWIGNARSYTVGGEIIGIKADGELLTRFEAGINPTRIVFF